MATPEAVNTPSVSPISDDVLYPTTRRSSRAKKAVRRLDDDGNDQAVQTRQSLPGVRKDRPKRKAAVAAAQSIIPEDAGPLLQEILAEMTPDERKEYRGWVELESEPVSPHSTDHIYIYVYTHTYLHLQTY